MFLLKDVGSLNTVLCSALSFCLIVTHLISFKVLKYLYKNLLESRGPCLLPPETDVMSFSCFFHLYFKSFFQLCHIRYNVPSHSPQFAFALTRTRNPSVFRLISETALKALMPY